MEKEMKPGDKVWIFDAGRQKIISEKIIEIEDRAVVAGSFRNFVGTFHLGVNCFPTREALCEHYRKIFE